MIRRRRETVFEVSLRHTVIARVGWWGGWDVLELTPQIGIVHHRSRRREQAEIVAEAIAATRMRTEGKEANR